jgi:hypothetical protein
LRSDVALADDFDDGIAEGSRIVTVVDLRIKVANGRGCTQDKTKEDMKEKGATR